jgi:hypothetical protein
MLFEIVQAWPYLFFASTSFGSTLIRLYQQSYPMYALLMAFEIVYSGETFFFPLAIYHVT